MSKYYYYICGNNGKNCPFNGEHKDRNGILIECRCDECNYMICCLDGQCKKCKDKNCYRKRILRKINYQRLKKLKKILKEILHLLGGRYFLLP